MILERLEDRCLPAPFSASFLNAVATFDEQGSAFQAVRSESTQGHSSAIAYGATRVDAAARGAHSFAVVFGERDWEYRLKGKELDVTLEHLIRREFNAPVFASAAGENGDVLRGLPALAATPPIGGGLTSKTTLSAQLRTSFVEPNLALSALIHPTLSAWYVDFYRAADELVVDPAHVEKIDGEADLVYRQGRDQPSLESGAAADQEPVAGTPLMGLMNVDLAALEQRMDALFCRLGQLAEPTSASSPRTVGPWLALTLAAVYQTTRWRRRRSAEEVVPGAENLFNPMWLPHKVLV